MKPQSYVLTSMFVGAEAAWHELPLLHRPDLIHPSFITMTQGA